MVLHALAMGGLEDVGDSHRDQPNYGLQTCGVPAAADSDGDDVRHRHPCKAKK